MTMWNPELGTSGARYLAIAEALAADIRGGRLKAGDRLPTHRDLAYRLGVTVGTVTRAYAEAARRGLIGGEVGRGTYVRDARPPVPFGTPGEADAGAEGPVDLSVNKAAIGEAGPLLAATLRRLAEASDLAGLLDYQPHRGRLRHRAAGAAWLARAGLAVDPDRVLVTNGGQHAMMVAFAGLCRPGDLVLTESLTYAGMKAVAGLLQLRLQGVATDGDGIFPEAFAAACRAAPVRALYCMPNLQNPTGSVMPAERRRAIAAIAAAQGVAIVEDDVYGFLDAGLPPPLAGFAPTVGHYLTSLSKCLAPGLRIGFLATPPGSQAGYVNALRATAWMAAPLMAEIAARWIEDGTADRLAGQRRQEAAVRQKLAAAALRGADWRAHPAGFHGWLVLPDRWTAEGFVETARRRGVIVTAAAAFAPGRPEVEAVRLCLCATPDRRQLEQALAVLAGLLRGEPETASSVV
jgi:DNA-binding transcriptional MocR family regulator